MPRVRLMRTFAAVAIVQALLGGAVAITRSEQSAPTPASEGAAPGSGVAGTAGPGESGAIGGTAARPPSEPGREEPDAGPAPYVSVPAAPRPELRVRTQYVELTREERADLEAYRGRITSPGRALSAEPVAEGRVDDGSIWRMYAGPDPARGICWGISELSRDRENYRGSGNCSAEKFSVEGTRHGGPIFSLDGFGDSRGHALLVSSADGRVATLPVARDARLDRSFFRGHFDCGIELAEARLVDRDGTVLAAKEITFSDAICREPGT